MTFFAWCNYDDVSWEIWVRVHAREGADTLFILLWLFFVLLNGRLTLEIALFGAAVAGLALLFACRYAGWSLKSEKEFLRRLPRLLLYGLYLLKEIAKANLITLRRVYARHEVEPAIVTFRTPLAKEWTRVLLANSITLTPGTITLLLKDDALTVHCLDKSDAGGLEGSDMEQRIAKMEDAK